MRKSLLAVITFITIATTGATTYIATLPDPTEAQTALATAGATIATTGATTLFEMLSDDKDDEDNNQDTE